MTNAYSELYFDDAMNNLGDMVEVAVCDLKLDPDEFFGWFISSGIASKIEKGNPKYISGMSGFEQLKLFLPRPMYLMTRENLPMLSSKDESIGLA